MKNAWKVIHEMDEENGEPTSWAKEVNHPKYGRFVWITKNKNSQYDIEVDRDGLITLATCKTVVSAKRWVSMNVA